MKMVDLNQLYTESLHQSDFPSENYRADRLKAKIQRDSSYSEKILFSKLSHGSTRSFIVYSSDIDVSTAVRHGYELGSLDRMKDAGSSLHQAITQSFEQSEKMKWPPSAHQL